MNLIRTAMIATALLGGALAAPHEASAMSPAKGLTAPSAVENVACRIVRQRVVTPGGRVIYRSSRICTPAVVRPPRCTTVRERIVTPGGRVVYRSVRRCG